MESCCTLKPGAQPTPTRCPECGRPGREVERITLKGLLRPEALVRLSAPEHRFCPTPECPVVYFGHGEVFPREDLTVPVFQKEPAGARTVCYCFAITERDLRRELLEKGRSTAPERVAELVKAGRCACEVKNPQGSCCLGNLATAARALGVADPRRHGDSGLGLRRSPPAPAAPEQGGKGWTSTPGGTCSRAGR